jgi:hypothetical protein
MRKNIFHLACTANDLRIAFHRHRGRLTGAIQYDEHRLLLILSGNDIDPLMGNELRLPSLNDSLAMLPPVKQLTKP